MPHPKAGVGSTLNGNLVCTKSNKGLVLAESFAKSYAFFFDFFCAIGCKQRAKYALVQDKQKIWKLNHYSSKKMNKNNV